jgi:4-amino-4-deoxy-L-arabinose transferase-like glycosyltransferase
MTTDFFRRHGWWLLILVTLAVLLPGTAVAPLFDRDEPRFATATREMLDRGDWIVPTFNGVERFDKPILSYWMMRAGYAAVGVNELGARLPAVGVSLILVLCTWLAGRRWFGPREGMAAGMGMATCIQFYIHGRLALADMPMVAAVAVACVAIAELLDPERSKDAPQRCWWWALYLSLAAGLLAKGPIALAVPVLALLLWRFVFWRQPLPWHRLGLWKGLLLVLVLVSAWGVPALVATGGRFFNVGIGEHVVRRGMEEFNGRAYSVFFYVKSAPLSLFPWIVFTGLVWPVLRRRWSSRNAWLASWLTAPYLIFTAYATQLPHYVLPGFPAFFLLLAQGLEMKSGLARRIGNFLLGLLLAVLACAAAWVAWTQLPAGMGPLRTGLLGGLAAVTGLVLAAAGYVACRGIILVSGLLAVAIGTVFLSSGLREVALSPRVAALAEQWPQGALKIGYGYSEPSMVFYGGGRWLFPSDPASLANELAKSGPVVVVAKMREIDPLRFFTGRVRWGNEPSVEGVAGWRSIDCAGLNIGRMRWQELRIYVRDDTPQTAAGR